MSVCTALKMDVPTSRTFSLVESPKGRQPCFMFRLEVKRGVQRGLEGLRPMELSKRHDIVGTDTLLSVIMVNSNVEEAFSCRPSCETCADVSVTMNEPIRNRFKRFIHKYLEENVDDEAKLTLHSLRQYYGTNFPSLVIHAHMTQETRIRHFQERQGFQDARRGVDGPRSNVVIDYDFPFDADTYSHLVGRADYVETKGLSISFVFNDDNKAVLKNVRIDLRSRMPIELDVADYMNVV
ncbi:MAG: hypothetical protein BYD32DRAFT_458234 [Podila humilis]|nr:MAG: hypothetical protein BYD32DRAFT_458234 [Podila humilis]